MLKFFLRLDILLVITGGYMTYIDKQPTGVLLFAAGIVILILRFVKKEYLMSQSAGIVQQTYRYGSLIFFLLATEKKGEGGIGI